MSMSVENEFNGLLGFLDGVLEKYPETRSNDTLLYIRSCEELGAKSLYDIEKLNLSIVSVHKTRQVLQNKHQRWLPSENVQHNRTKRKFEIKNYMSKIAN